MEGNQPLYRIAPASRRAFRFEHSIWFSVPSDLLLRYQTDTAASELNLAAAKKTLFNVFVLVLEPFCQLVVAVWT
jgi:hypothetical protein